MTATAGVPSELLPTRDSLISRLKDCEDQDAWKQFFDSYSGLIYKVALKAGLTEAEAQDVVQETVITAVRNMGRFRTGSEHGSFKAWLMTTTRWRIADQFRRRAPESMRRPVHTSADGAPRTATLDRIPDPNGYELEALWGLEWCQHRVALAMAGLRKRVSAKQYQIFQMLTARELSPADVAGILGVSRSLVYVTKHRLSKVLKQELQRVERELP